MGVEAAGLRIGLRKTGPAGGVPREALEVPAGGVRREACEGGATVCLEACLEALKA